MSASLGAQPIRIEQLKEPAFVWDPDRARIVDANAPALSLWNEPSVSDLLDREFDPACALNESLAREAMGETSQAVERELALPFAAGERLAKCYVAFRKLSDGRRGFLIAILGAPTEENTEQLTRLAKAAHEAPAALLAVDAEGRVLSENDAARALFGPGREAELGQRLGSDKDAKAILEAALLNGRAGGTRRISTRVGMRRVRLNARRTEDPITERPLIVIHAADVEDQRNREAELRAQNEILEEFLQAGTDFMLELDQDMRVAFVSGSILSHLGVEAPALIGTHWRDLTMQFRLITGTDVDLALSARSGWRDGALTVERSTGDMRYLTSARSIQNERGDFRGYRVVGREAKEDTRPANLTEFKRPVAATAPPAHDGFAEIVKAAPWAVIIQRGFDVLFVNTAFAEMFAFPMEITDTPRDIAFLRLFPQSERTLSADYDKLIGGEVAFAVREMEGRRLDGRSIVAEMRSRAITWEGEPAVEYVIEDVSARTREKRAGEQRATILSAMIDAVPEGVMLLDASGRVEWSNLAALRLCGLADADDPPHDISDIFAPEDAAWAKDYISGLVDGGLTRLFSEGREVGIVRADGTRVSALLALDRIDAGAQMKICAVMRDLTQWKRTEAELRTARTAAESESSRKTEFLARVSHELRTPLTAILGFAEIMSKEELGPLGTPKYAEYAQDILSSGDHLLSLINDLLDMSKVESGNLHLDFDSVDLAYVAEACVKLMSAVARTRKVRLYTELPEGLPAIVGDERSLRQVLLNLISNALRYTEEGGEVVVTAGVDESGGLTLRVRDTGVGMSADELKIAMEPFEQVEKKVAAGTPGTGLGLPLAKALAEANRAYFKIVSEPASGTTVAITFPPTQVLA